MITTSVGAVRTAARTTFDAIVPPVCLSCHVSIADHNSLCGACWRGISFIRPPLCDRLGLPMPYGGSGRLVSAAAAAEPPLYGRARAVASFDGIMRQMILGFKFGDRHDARRLFTRWLAQAGAELLADADLLMPVPLARWRLLRRQFNQAAILAQELGHATGKRFDPLALQRRRKTPSQVGLSREQRRENVRGAFAVRKGGAALISGRGVLLIDDVVTTGATVEACARTLLAAGARSVDVLALALVTDPRQVSL